MKRFGEPQYLQLWLTETFDNVNSIHRYYFLRFFICQQQLKKL